MAREMAGSRLCSRRGALGLGGIAALAAAPALALALPPIAALSKIERGRWVVRDPEAGERHSLCLGDPMLLARLEHRGDSCSGELLASDGTGGTVQYRCPGRGFGHTSVRVETPRLVRVDTQGLVGGRPFAYRAEARRVGEC